MEIVNPLNQFLKYSEFNIFLKSEFNQRSISWYANLFYFIIHYLVLMRFGAKFQFCSF